MGDDGVQDEGFESPEQSGEFDEVHGAGQTGEPGDVDESTAAVRLSTCPSGSASSALPGPGT